MARGGFRPRRTVAEWAVRGGLIAVVAWLGYFSTSISLGNALLSNPRLAHSLAPGNGQLTGRLAQRLLTPNASPVTRERAARLARLALEQDGTSVHAVSTLGLHAQLAGNVKSARQLFAYSQKLSRRDLATQLWAIEDAVAREDIPGALNHYDIALRSSKAAPGILFPILASAINDAKIRDALSKVLVTKPAWGEPFIDYVAGSGPDPVAAAILMNRARRTGVPVSEAARAGVVGALIAGGHLDEAWSYYATLHRGADKRQSRDPNFKNETASPTQFDWTPVGEAGVSASIQRGQDGGVFSFTAPSSVGGAALQQLQLLPPGTYRLSGHSADIEQSEGSRPYWTLRCRDGRELGRVSLPNSNVDNGRFSGAFTVPAECVSQALTLVVRPSDAVSGVYGQIDEVRLLPASAAARRAQLR